MKIQAYQCRFSGEIFRLDEREEYISHLTSIREKKKADRQHRNAIREWNKWLTSEKENIKEFSQIAPWVIKNFNFIIKNYGCLHRKNISGECSELKFQCKYKSLASNSHSAPRGKPENWCSGNKNLPNGYPGYTGSISGIVQLIGDHSWLSDVFKFFDICLVGGSGPSRYGEFNYNVNVYIEDWPGLKDELVVKTLKGECQ